jgi:hypothetical protein
MAKREKEELYTLSEWVESIREMYTDVSKSQIRNNKSKARTT